MKKIVYLFFIVALFSCSKDDVGLSFDKQLEADIAIIDQYLLDNELDAEVHESGIRYIHDVIGEGESPESGDLVVIKYKGTLLNGTFFGEDSLGFTLKLGAPTIEVLQLIIPLMNVGGQATIFSPSGYSFGKYVVGSAPANSNLIFEVELIAIIKSAEDQLVADENIIDEYLLEKDIAAEIHSSGIRFITLVEGTGASPTSTDIVSVKYKGTFLNGQIFDQSTSAISFTLSTLIESWRIMIPTMKVGGKIAIYSPSQYCYGATGSSSIGPNTILVFEIELLSF